ncbi:MAG TPA: chemotaxis protein CheA, partial [Vicinamibacteria bacterium]|nr:chemotaxis protein CheA [Vicinamibacteria bacterium]
MTPAAAALLERLRDLGAETDGPGNPGAGEPSPANAPGGAHARPEGAPDRAPARTLRVSLETLDRILDLTGEIAVDRERLRAALETTGGQTSAAAEIHRDTDRLHADLQELVMKARMEPIGPTFRRFARTVRDLSTALGKAARLSIEGEDVEVD